MRALIIILTIILIQFQLLSQSKIELTDVSVVQHDNIITSQIIRQNGFTDLLDETFDSLTNQTTTKGFNACILLPDGSTWKRANGISGTHPEVTAMTTEHQLGMGSITKTFISTTLLLMIEDGLLSLDDSLYQYLPPYKNIDNNVTIRGLLGHTSGFNDYLNENSETLDALDDYPDSIWVNEQIINNFISTPNFKPGTSWSYSNTNYLLAGKIIENISGHPWYKEVRNRILIPLNLTSIYFPPSEFFDRSLLAHPFYDYHGEGIVEDGFKYDDFNGILSMVNSAGGNVSTPYDLTVFMKAISNNDFLSQSSINEMKYDNVNNPFSGIKYGLGLMSYDIGIENWGHNGSAVYQSISLYFPKYDISICVQQNESDLSSLEYITFKLIETYISIIENSTNTQETKIESVIVFPTIVKDCFTIVLPLDYLSKNIDIKVFDSNGAIVIKKQLDTKTERIYVTDLPKGIYHVKIGVEIFKISLI